jgi:putative endonuclease
MVVIPTKGFSPRGGTCCPVSRVTVFRETLRDHDQMGQRYYVYIVASKSRVLYVGVTNDLRGRVREHQHGIYDGFTLQYKVHRLVYYEVFGWVQDAIAREKQIKRWRREKKVWLIERENPTWEDLSDEWTKPAMLRIHHPV